MKEILSLVWLLFMILILFGLLSGIQIHLTPFSIKFPTGARGLVL